MADNESNVSFEASFEPDHADRLTVLQYNWDNTKLLTASIDHRVAVYTIDRSTSNRKRLDLWTTHDSEIRDARWFHPSTGTHFVTISHDLQMRVWVEDVTQAPMSGRRFRRIATIKSQQLIPYASVDVKTVGNHTTIAAIDRQGLLSLYEPTNPDEYHEWSLVDQFYACSPMPERGDHTSFRLQFDPNPYPLPFIESVSEDRAQLSLAVTVMNEVKLYRTTSDPNIISSHAASQSDVTNIGRGATRRFLLFEVLRVQLSQSQPQTSAGSLLRDVAFSPNNIRGFDALAVASINGTVAVYEVTLQHKDSLNTPVPTTSPSKQPASRPAIQSQHSNLTSALHSTNAPSNTNQQALSRSNHPFPYVHHATPISVLQHAHTDAWSVNWEASGELLISNGSDGIVKIWKRVVNDSGRLSGFELIAEQAGEEESGTESGTDSQED